VLKFVALILLIIATEIITFSCLQSLLLILKLFKLLNNEFKKPYVSCSNMIQISNSKDLRDQLLNSNYKNYFTTKPKAK